MSTTIGIGINSANPDDIFVNFSAVAKKFEYGLLKSICSSDYLNIVLRIQFFPALLNFTNIPLRMFN